MSSLRIPQFAAQLAEAITAQRKAEEATAIAVKARDEAEAAKKDVEKKNKETEYTCSIPKPKASEMSDGTDRLRKAMELQDDKATYLAIQVSGIQSNVSDSQLADER